MSEIEVQNKENLQPSALPKEDAGLTAARRKPSRIPMPNRARQRAALSAKTAALPRATSRPSPAPCPPSQVKEVPDFKRLHHKWANRLEKKKQENKVPTQFRQFSLTPAGKFSAKKLQKAANQPEATPLSSAPPCGDGDMLNGSFEVHEQSLHAILSEQPIRLQPQPDHRATIGPSTRTLSRMTTADFVSGLRYSIYRRRPPHPCGDSHTKHQLPKDVFGQLLKGLSQSTAARAQTKCLPETEEEPGLREVKLNLDFQFSQVADAKEGHSIQRTTSTNNMNPAAARCEPHGSDTSQASACDKTECGLPQLPAPLPSKALVTPLRSDSSTQCSVPRRPVTELQCPAACHRDTSSTIGLQLLPILERADVIPPQGKFYGEEAELALLGRVLLPSLEDRKECGDPVAATLEAQTSTHCFIPIRE